MIQFFKQILKKIQQFDEYTSQYLKITNNIENARNENCIVRSGGGGNYGKVSLKK